MRSLVLRVLAVLTPTVRIPNATGLAASTADATDIPTRTASWSSLPELDEVKTDTAEISRTREVLHQAIQDHLCALYDTPMVTTDFVIVAENVTDDGNYILYPAMSGNLSSWKCVGMAVAGFNYFSRIGSAGTS